MIKLETTRTRDSSGLPLMEGICLRDEGQAMVAVKVNGKLYCQPATGVASDLDNFVGISVIGYGAPWFDALVEVFTIPETGIVELQNTPMIDTVTTKPAMYVVENVTGGVVFTALTTGDPEAGTSFVLDGKKATFAVDDAGKEIKFQYRYELTVCQAHTLVGDGPLVSFNVNETRRVPLQKEAEVGTSFYDSSVDWTDVMYVKTAADGFLTPAATAAEGLPHVYVMNTPSSDNAYLTIKMDY